MLSFLEIRAERRQNSIFVEFSFATVFAFKHHVSAVIHYIKLLKRVLGSQTFTINFWLWYVPRMSICTIIKSLL